VLLTVGRVKDRRRQPEGGECEPIKIHQCNLTYIPKSPTLLSSNSPRPRSYRKTIGNQNRIRNHENTAEITIDASQDTCETMMAKSESKGSSNPHRHFTEHLADVFEEPPRESNLDSKTSSFFIRSLKIRPTFTLQQSTGNTIKNRAGAEAWWHTRHRGKARAQKTALGAP
jgi:hypothetical protein